MVDKSDKNKKFEEKEEEKEKQPLTIKKVVILMSAGFAVILLITVVTLVLVLKKPSTNTATVTPEQTTEKKQDNTTKKSDDKKEESKEKEGETSHSGKKTALFYTIKPVFIVNLNSNRVKFLQIGVDVMTHSQEVIVKLTDNLPLIKNELIILFSNRNHDEVKTLEGREALRREALKVIKNVIEKETGNSTGIEDVLFTGFVVQ
jgi:flagellar FliL protein